MALAQAEVMAGPEPAVDTGVRVKRWTLEEYYALFEKGILEGRYELIDGEIIEHMPKLPVHAYVLSLLAIWLESFFGRTRVRTQDPTALDAPGLRPTEPEPDICVTRNDLAAYLNEHPHGDDLLLVCEVSHTTPNYDLGRKAMLYARTGVMEYWVIDINGRKLVAHRYPSAEGYRETHIYTESDVFVPMAMPDAAPAVVSSFLPPAAVDGSAVDG